MRHAKDFRGEERILVVEDDSDLRALTSQTLRDYGYRVSEAEDGVEALELFRQGPERPDLLLTDMVMPNGVNGATLAEQLTQELRSLRVIYSSGYSPELISGRLPLLDGINYLPKPYNPAKLLRTVRRCLDTVIEPASAAEPKGK
jgi:CheY-like chemotaxis protein